MIPLRNLLRHKVRTALALIGLAVTSALLLDMILLSGGLEESFANLLQSRGFQVRVAPKGTLPFDTEATIPGITGVLAGLRADPDVERAAPILGGAVYVRRGDSLETLFGYGVDPEAQALYEVIEGRDLTRGDSTGLLVSEPVARGLGLAAGDTVTLVSLLDPQAAVATVEVTFQVRGLVRWLYDPRGQRSVGAVLPTMQRLTRLDRGDRASAIALKIRDGVPVGGAVERLRALFPGLEINSVADMVVYFRQRMVYFHQLSLILGTISLFVTLLLVGTLLTITVNERLGEIATLRAIGVGRWRIVRMVVAEGAVLTLAGAAGGTLLGLATARFLDRILTSFPGLPASISFFVPRPGGLALAAGVLLVSGLLAGAWPAWRAAGAPIAATLRAEAT